MDSPRPVKISARAKRLQKCQALYDFVRKTGTVPDLSKDVPSVTDSSRPAVEGIGATSTKRQKLQSVFDCIRKTGTVPDLRDDVEVMLNKKSFDKVIAGAQELNRVDRATEFYSTYDLRPWQEKVIADLETQNNRTVLWVFDYEDGETSKTELVEYLCVMKKYQQIGPGSSKKAFPHLKCYANGYVIDFTQTRHLAPASVTQTYGLIKDIKDGILIGTGGHQKLLQSSKIVVFANFPPNMKCLRMDQWSFYHTTLGPIYLHCEKANRGYTCFLTTKKNRLDGNVTMTMKYATVKTEEEFLKEHFDLFGKVDE